MSTSCFDLEKFGEYSRDDLKYLAKMAEVAERYEDMCKCMKALVAKSQSLDVEERNLLSVAYKNVIGTRRASWRTISTHIEDVSGDYMEGKFLNVYKAQVEKELESTCKEMLNLLSDKLIPDAEGDGEPQVFYLKMAGDYYRYLAEALEAQTDNTENGKKAAEFYEKAYSIAEKELPPTHPIRLGLALNYSVCHYEILKDQKKACELAKKAFDEAISKLDKLEETDYKDSTLIMQLLRDNLTLWTASDQDDGGCQVEDLSGDEAN